MRCLNESAELLSQKYLFFHLEEFVSQEAKFGLFYISHNTRQWRAESRQSSERNTAESVAQN